MNRIRRDCERVGERESKRIGKKRENMNERERENRIYVQENRVLVRDRVIGVGEGGVFSLDQKS